VLWPALASEARNSRIARVEVCFLWVFGFIGATLRLSGFPNDLQALIRGDFGCAKSAKEL
jgi:hypothetical protein